MTEHTELPWKIEIRQNNIAILSGDKVVALMCVKPDNDHLYKPIVVEANAEYIVQACNSRKDLLAACEISETCFRKLAEIDILTMSKPVLLDNANLIKAAIKKAKL